MTLTKGAKFFDGNRCSGFKGKICDGLSDVTVDPNNLFNREPINEQIPPVQCRRRANVGGDFTSRIAHFGRVMQMLRAFLNLECLNKWVKKDRHSVDKLVLRWLCIGAAVNHDATTIN